MELARAEIERAARQGIAAYYVEAIPGFDRAAYERLADLIPEERFVPFVHVWNHGLPLSDQQTWVTSRFHLHLLAAAARARGIAVGMKKGYYDVKHESVTALGSGWPLALDEGSPAMPAQAGPLAAKLPALLARKRAEAETSIRRNPAFRPSRLPVPPSCSTSHGAGITAGQGLGQAGRRAGR